MRIKFTKADCNKAFADALAGAGTPLVKPLPELATKIQEIAQRNQGVKV